MTVFVASIFTAAPALADIFNQETLKTHLRWNLMVPRDQFFINKKDGVLNIETVNLESFHVLAGEIARINANDQYIESVAYSKDNFPAKPATIIVKLKNPSVELFSFYRDADKKYILDFWINADLVSEKAAGFKKPLPLPTAAQEAVFAPKKEALNKNALLTRKSNFLPVVEVSKAKEDQEQPHPGFRDFRYGASFIWDCRPMIP